MAERLSVGGGEQSGRGEGETPPRAEGGPG